MTETSSRIGTPIARTSDLVEMRKNKDGTPTPGFDLEPSEECIRDCKEIEQNARLPEGLVLK